MKIEDLKFGMRSLYFNANFARTTTTTKKKKNLPQSEFPLILKSGSDPVGSFGPWLQFLACLMLHSAGRSSYGGFL